MAFCLEGTLTVSKKDLIMVRAALPDHILATRTELGCLFFDVVEASEGLLKVHERFVDYAAFAEHQKRIKNSHWAIVTSSAYRDYQTFNDDED